MLVSGINTPGIPNSGRGELRGTLVRPRNNPVCHLLWILSHIVAGIVYIDGDMLMCLNMGTDEDSLCMKQCSSS